MIEVSEANRLLTAEQFAQMPESEHAELIRGEMVTMAPTVDKHGVLSSEIYYHVRQFIEANDIVAYITVEGTGYTLFRNPDTVRAPDVAVLLQSTYSGGLNDDYFPVAPDLAIEIVSKNDRADEVQDKVNEYLGAGSRLVWVVYPTSRQIIVHTPTFSRIYNRNDTIDGGEVLPNFTISLEALFSVLG